MLRYYFNYLIFNGNMRIEFGNFLKKNLDLTCSDIYESDYFNVILFFPRTIFPE